MQNRQLPSLCRDCGHIGNTASHSDSHHAPCPACGGNRIIAHAELTRLTLAHIDCDAFYAAVEKRDNPALKNKPVIIGGGRRGVVATACYVARIHGIRSAMPLFRAKKLCPDAVVIAPRMTAYREAGMQIREIMQSLTPLVEPLSIDEAFLDLAGTEGVHGMPPAAALAALARRIKAEVGVTISIGLAPNKSLAKIASEQDKPAGFFVIGAAEAETWLADKPVSILYGVGRSLLARLKAAGITTCGDLARADARLAARLAGEAAEALQLRARGIDRRRVTPDAPAKSISSETTFETDTNDRDALLAWLEVLSEKVSTRLKKKNLGCRRIMLKLKDGDFNLVTRSHTLPAPTRMGERIFATTTSLLEKELARHEKGRQKRYRLIGVAAESLTDIAAADPPDLADPDRARRHRLEAAIDKVRARHGDGKIIRGRRLQLERK